MTRERSDVAVLTGLRTPFVKADGQLRDETPLSLGVTAAQPLVDDFELGKQTASRMNVIWGTSLPYPRFLYGGREIALAAGLTAVDGHATEYACATSLKTAADGALRIRAGEADVIVAGGSESLSHQPHQQDARATELASLAVRGKSDAIAAVLDTIDVADLVPRRTPLTEPYSDLDMVHYADQLMRAWGVTRQDADHYTALSHTRAGAAREYLAKRIVPTGAGQVVVDDMIRPDSSPEKLAGLPAARPELGDLVSVGNASRLTDGAGAVLLASREWTETEGHTPLGWIRATAFTAHAPGDGVLLGPSFAIPRCLDRAGLTFADIDVVELHEAFAGQILANLAALTSPTFAAEKLGRSGAVATSLSPDDINSWGGSLAIGHPFGATGARLITQTLDRLHAEGGRFGVIGLCVGGTRGAAMVVEAAR